MGPSFHRVAVTVRDELRARPEVVGIVLARPSGGRYDKNSDLDFYVLVDTNWRQRLQLLRDGVPVEVFMNPPKQARRSIAEGESSTIAMLAFGEVLLDRAGEVAQLAQLARERWERGPDPPDVNTNRMLRYGIVDLLEDAEDVLECDPAAAMLALHQTIAACVRYLYAANRRWGAKAKHQVADLEAWYPEAAACVRAAVLAAEPGAAYAAVRRLAQVTLGQKEIHFFEWETLPGEV